jgi:hypothetical protein
MQIVCCGILSVLAIAAQDAMSLGGAAAIRAPEPNGVMLGETLRPLIVADWEDRDARFGSALPTGTSTEEVASATITAAEDAAGGCDGIKNGKLGFHTASLELDPWWQVDLGREYLLDRIVVYNRTDGNTAARTRHLQILIARDTPEPAFERIYAHDGGVFHGAAGGPPLVVSLASRKLRARLVRLQVPGRCSFALDEVEVFAIDRPDVNVALGRPADQKSTSRYSARSPGRAATPAHNSTPDPLPRTSLPRFSLQHSQWVLEQADGLVTRLKAEADPKRLGPLEQQLVAMRGRLQELQHLAPPEPVRREFYLNARWLARRVAFCNPQLNFDRLLFIKRPLPGGLYHMVHQFYGFCATPGGGLFVLSQPFLENPALSDVLSHARVARGRLEGQSLVNGAFLAPDLSPDGRQVLFAYSECRARGVEWSPSASFHIFQANLDGTALTQLTDGPWNDFDPCYLPDGRIAFVSERRGGYLRCGGSAPPYDSPTYTLHSMASDGSDVTCLSFHETQEWQPSVAHDGRLVYTRWDYVDRDTNIAHHIWTCYPDGRDPRSFHGNYPVRRESRPWMEMDIRAVPGSPCFVATAAAHHGHAFGSLVLIDPRLPDDNAMSQLRRLTPDVPFPESEGGKAAIRSRMAYGTAWPLSEDDFLCAYDAAATNHGIYWIDRFGNRELLYRDPRVPCLSPIPMRPRPLPPPVPTPENQTLAPLDGRPQATVAVMNVYDSDFGWPPGSKIAALRIIQLLPKTTPPANQPRIGIGNQTNARAVLGTVPVESDGSAFFAMPPGKTFYLQAIDEEGCAVQSMRSATYLHPGEHLSCRGCHESKYAARGGSQPVPLALRRAPSPIDPDVDGSNPFNYVRLVQPVWDRHCVECHRKQKTLDLSGSLTETHGWSQSYLQLAPRYAFYFDVNNGSINRSVHGGSRTVVGKFGARASQLMEYLDARHYGVSLSPEERYRVTLWLDCNSEFYGSYEQTRNHGPLSASAHGSAERSWRGLQ